eukprot:1828633-Prymnesium_polylepis.1
MHRRLLALFLLRPRLAAAHRRLEPCRRRNPRLLVPRSHALGELAERIGQHPADRLAKAGKLQDRVARPRHLLRGAADEEKQGSGERGVLIRRPTRPRALGFGPCAGPAPPMPHGPPSSFGHPIAPPCLEARPGPWSPPRAGRRAACAALGHDAPLQSSSRPAALRRWERTADPAEAEACSPPRFAPR